MGNPNDRLVEELANAIYKLEQEKKFETPEESLQACILYAGIRIGEFCVTRGGLETTLDDFISRLKAVARGRWIDLHKEEAGTSNRQAFHQEIARLIERYMHLDAHKDDEKDEKVRVYGELISSMAGLVACEQELGIRKKA